MTSIDDPSAIEGESETGHSLALTRPAHIRKAAAALFNKARQRWAEKGSAAEMRTIGYFLSLTRQAMVDIDLEARVIALETRYEEQYPTPGRQKLAAPLSPPPSHRDA